MKRGGELLDEVIVPLEENMDSLIFVHGPNSSKNKAIAKELSGHAKFSERDAGPGEPAPRLLFGDEELAANYIDIYDVAHFAHRLHERKKIYAEEGRQTPPLGPLQPVIV